MNTYIAFWKGKKIEVKAENPYQAQLMASAELKAKHSYDITVVLAFVGDREVIHSTAEID
jgi:hypothetical protein